MAKYLIQYAMVSSDKLRKALRIAFNLDELYPIRQIEAVFKCKGLRDANEIIDREKIGISHFVRNYYSYTGSEKQMELCDAEGSGIILGYSTCCTKFVGWDKVKEIIEQLPD